MSKPGLPQGYVAFGTVAERLLRILHTSGPLRERELVEEAPELSRGHIAVTLIRLRRAGLLFKQGLARHRETRERTATLWGTEPPREWRDVGALSSAERVRRFRAAKKMRKPSVFEFRGTVSIRGRVE